MFGRLRKKCRKDSTCTDGTFWFMSDWPRIEWEIYDVMWFIWVSALPQCKFHKSVSMQFYHPFLGIPLNILMDHLCSLDAEWYVHSERIERKNMEQILRFHLPPDSADIKIEWNDSHKSLYGFEKHYCWELSLFKFFHYSRKALGLPKEFMKNNFGMIWFEVFFGWSIGNTLVTCHNPMDAIYWISRIVLL